ncbi:MAG TPA: alpha/beta fold hydrolase [Stellaceae bacterium]|nr:alpha/beta fold hydrolase [Stellaceae bacterium]
MAWAFAGTWLKQGASPLRAAAIVIALAVPAAAQSANLATDSYRIPAADPGIELYLRNKHPAGVESFPAEKILLFVHGATYPAETAFDLPLGGRSMMEMIAERGWDVWLVDMRGYGGSTRPPEMDQPADQAKPFADTPTAVKDVSAAVEHILKKRGAAKLNLMGWSWGTAIMGMYTGEHNDKVNRLVLYAPLWLFKSAPLIGGDGPLGAYRTVTKDSAKARWLKDVPEDKKADLIPAGWFEQWADATWASDAGGAKQNPPVLRAPNGVLQDLRTYWTADKPQHDPGEIKVPTMLIHAEWDADLPSYQAQAYFAKLTHAPYKRFVELGEGTHTVMMEKNRMQFFHELMAFLDESNALALK